MDAKQVQNKLHIYRQDFEQHFHDYFVERKKSFVFPRHSSLTRKAIELIEDLSLRGGKRQRVAFLYEAFCLFRSDYRSVEYGLIDCAISIELLQTHLLIHDDLVDNSPTRRGGPTTFQQAQQLQLGRPERALAVAVMAGDIAAYLALDILLQSRYLSDSQKKQLSMVQTRAGIDTFLGQIFDVERDKEPNFSEEGIVALADYKATQSSVNAPLFMGAIMADQGDDHTLQRLRRYGYNVGIAGQLHDDYMGVFGREADMGKSNTSDISEGKRTLLMIYAKQHALERDAAFLENIIQHGTAKPADIERAKQIMLQTKANLYIRKTAAAYARRAAQEARVWKDWHPDAANFFAASAEWFIRREE